MENKTILLKVLFCIGGLASIVYVFIPFGQTFLGSGPSMWDLLTSDGVMTLLSFAVDSEFLAMVVAALVFWLPAALMLVATVILFIPEQIKYAFIVAIIAIVDFFIVDMYLMIQEVIYAGIFVNLGGIVLAAVAIAVLFQEEQQEGEIAFEDRQAGGEITCLAGEYAGGTFYADNVLVIGRDAGSANVILSNKKVSRTHCIITYVPETDTYTVKDTSSNGTFFSDGQRLVKDFEMQVPKGTEIHLGKPKEIFRLN